MAKSFGFFVMFSWLPYFTPNYLASRASVVGYVDLNAIIIIIIIIIIISPWESFTSSLADGLQPEFEWQQVSSSLQESSQYSGRSQ